MKKHLILMALLTLCVSAYADTLGDMRRLFNLERAFNASGDATPNFTAGYQVAGSNVTSTEAAYVDGVTAGTTTASKALVVDADKKLDGGLLGKTLYSTVAASTAFGGTGANVEANFSNGSYSVAAGSLVAGDVIRIRAHVTIPTTVSTDTLRIYVNVGDIAGTAVYDSGAINVSDADMFLADITISVRTVGATGTMYAVATRQSTQATTFAVLAPIATALSSIDTTAALPLTVSAVWSTENANACSLQQFIVTK